MGRFRIDIRHWAQLSRLLDDALDRPAALRLVWIDTLGSEFDELKPELRRLLANAALIESGDYLDTVPSLTLDPLDVNAAPALHAGEIIGPYRLLRELGTGGMGDVWLAERSDGLIQRPVALKLPHVAWRRAGLARRLAREREILASLTHPNIARLYDVGVAADGQPFLAIEYVDGDRIDFYCRTRDLDIPARLRLVVQVSRAVAYAHSKLVVHRDLKPANILVSADGAVHLLDFGIARLLNANKGEGLTELAGLVLTPDYASPEQIRGELIGAGSDVYSLGVLTFELLTGERPYRLDRSSRAALEQAIVEAEPRRPSDVAPPPWRRLLRGDLDTIVFKALKKDVGERYASADAFADDLERHLDARPVLARPDRVGYRFGRFLRRNRLPMGAAAIATLAMIAGTAVALWQAQIARAEQRRTQQANEFIADVFRQADPNGADGQVYSAADLLRQAERRLQEDPDADPRLQVELLATIGDSQFGLQEHADALRAFQKALDHALRDDIDDPQLLARIHLGLSQNLEYVGRFDDAQLAVERSIALLQAAALTHSRLFARARVQQSALAIGRGDDMETAERAAHEAIAAAEAADEPSVPELATALQRLSHIYTRTQRRRESVEPARRSYELLETLYAGNAAHPQLLEATTYYAQALHSSGDFEGAVRLYTQGLDRAVHVFGADSRIVGELLGARSPAELDRGNVDQAVDDAERALHIYLQQARGGSADHADRVRKLGTALIAARRAPEAAQRLDEALRLASSARAALLVTHSQLNLGLALAHLGRFEQADAALHAVLAGAGPNATRARHLAQRNLGTSLRMQGRPSEALPYLEQAIAGASIEPSHRGDLAQGLVEAAFARLALDDLESAAQLLARAEPLFAEVHRERMSPARADLLLAQGRLRLARGDVAAAVDPLERAGRYWRGRDENSRWAGEADAWLAASYRRAGRMEEADASSRRARRILGNSLPLNSNAFPL